MGLSVFRRAWISATLLTAVLGGEASAQVVGADRLLLPATTHLGDGAVFLNGGRFLHGWDWNASTTGGTNTFVGIEAGNFWNPSSPAGIEAQFNTGVGASALRDIETGARNTGIGASALGSTTGGWGNTAVGADALASNQDGGNNTAAGDSALARNVDGMYNDAFGSGALAFTTGSYNAAFGGMNHNTTGSENTAVGRGSLHENRIGWANTAVGRNSLLSNHSGDLNTAVGYQADIQKDGYVNATAIGANAIATASNMVRIGDSGVTVIEGQVPFSWVSDRRWKQDIETLEIGLDLLRQLRPVSYRLKNGNRRLDMGFVAQEVEAVLGDGYNLVTVADDAERRVSMRYTDLIAPLVRAVQELDQQRGAAEAELALLRRESAAMRDQLVELVDLRGQLLSDRTQDRARIDVLERTLQAVLTSLEGGGTRRSAFIQP